MSLCLRRHLHKKLFKLKNNSILNKNANIPSKICYVHSKNLSIQYLTQGSKTFNFLCDINLIKLKRTGIINNKQDKTKYFLFH